MSSTSFRNRNQRQSFVSKPDVNKSMQSLDNKTVKSQYPSMHLNTSFNDIDKITFSRIGQSILSSPMPHSPLPQKEDIFGALIHSNGLLSPPQNMVGLSQQHMFELLCKEESDLMLEMARLHPNSVDFQDKYQQYLKVRNLKSELEKQMILGQVNVSPGNPQPKQSPADFSRSNEISELLQQGYGDSTNNSSLRQNGKGYIVKEGFVVDIDFASFLPSYFFEVQIHFGAFKKGQAFEPYFHSAVRGSEKETPQLSKCDINEHRLFQNVQPQADQILYFEMYANERESDKKKLVLKAWTMHELFDEKLILNCGKFKLPFYNKKINPKLFLKGGLPKIQESYLYIRIYLAPEGTPFEQSSYIRPERPDDEYKLPFFHSREVQAISFGGDKNGNNGSGNLTMMSDRDIGGYDQDKNGKNSELDFEKEQLALEKEKLALEREKLAQARQQDAANAAKLSKQMILEELQRAQEKQKAEERLAKAQRDKDNELALAVQEFANDGMKSNRTSRLNPYSSENPNGIPQQNNGLIIKILNVNNMQSNEKNVKITIKLMIGESLMEERNSSEGCHHTFHQDLKKPNNSLQLVRFFKTDIQQLAKENRKELLSNCFIRITLTSTHSIGWTFLPLFKTNYAQAQINQGTFKDNLYESPAKRPPFTRKCDKVQEILEYVVEVQDQKDTYDSTVQRVHQPSPLVRNSMVLDNYPGVQDRTGMGTNRSRQQDLNKTESVYNNTTMMAQSRSQEKERNILAVDLQVIKDFTNSAFFAYDIALVHNGQPIKDEFAHPTIYNCKQLVQPTPEEDEVQLNQMVKLAVDVDVIMAKKPSGWQNFELIFKMVEVDQQTGNERTIAWLIHPLFLKGKPNYGKFDKQLFLPPLQKKSPVDLSKIKYRKEHLCYSIKAEKIKQSQYEDYRVPQVMVSAPPIEFSRMGSLQNTVKIPSLNHIPIPDARMNTKTSILGPQTYNALNTQQSMPRDNKSLMNQRKAAKRYTNNQSASSSNGKRAFIVQLELLKGLEKPVDLYTRVAILKDDEPLIDDVGDPATFQGEVKRSKDGGIYFNEEFVFEINMRRLFEREQDNMKNIYLLFYFLNVENEPMYWYYCQIFKNGKEDMMLQGQFDVFLYHAPLQRLNEIKLIDLKSTKVTINIFLKEAEVDENNENIQQI